MTLKVSNHTFVCEGKNMQRFLWVLLLMTSTCYAEVNQTGPYIVKSLQKQVENLTAENQQLKQQLADKDKEIERLKSLCRKNNINIPISPAFTDSPKQAITKDLNSQPTEPIIYRGQELTKEWFETMYEKFRDKFIYKDGKYINIGEILLGDSYEAKGGITVFKLGNSEIPEKSLAKITEVEVLSVLGNGEILTIEDGQVLHIHGLNISFVDGKRFSLREPVLLTGSYQYISAGGAARTVPSFLVCNYLSRADFKNLINSNIELIEYVKIGDGIPIQINPQTTQQIMEETLKDFDLKVRQSRSQQPASKFPEILRGAKADAEILRNLAQEYPDLHIDTESIGKKLNSINTAYEKALQTPQEKPQKPQIGTGGRFR
jgi:hypothetical protein